ncbi:uncharacterized protein DNG_04984 [Cephalotrichum gorgonifer]|uniref:Zn(2)-C6 fungal-type domain-containing protein n=1 Tax=Cephalotrichum gorgonifer TaxID=2041049 RepID=A0AAE8SV38_9PEZI|nr:uncharacterized protein DNG_04984 [Cephalotrichum gorgonifer]
MSLNAPSQADVQSRDGVSELPDPRVGQACIACRRKKVKCDGKQPCFKCSSRDQACEYPGSRDNASASRYYATSFEARCQQMDALCRRLEDLAGQLTHSINSLNQSPTTATHGRDTANEDLLQAAQVLKSMPELRSSMHGPASGGGPAPESRPMGIANGYQPRHATLNPPIPYHLENSGPVDSGDDDDLDSDLDSQDSTPGQDAGRETNRAGTMVKDSYGRLRFVGGATNNMLIEAVQSLSSAPSASSMTAGPPGASHPHDPSDGVEIPFFIRGKTWPDLPFLPKPEQLSRPPQYTADLLVGLYFEKLHYTFPVLFEPQFMQQYRQMCRAPSDAPSSQDRRFLMVFFGVCACASSLISGNSERGFAGIEHYEKALLLYYASTGEASLERVQCLALLSMCAAGWNTLTQSWILAAQAVRAALDIGLHLSGRLIMPTTASPDRVDPSEFLRMQISRRIWWSVYSLDRVTSICLGRPFAVHDEDCYCEMPLNISDDDLEQHCRILKQNNAPAGHRAPGSGQSPPLSGFLAFARLCRIAGRIQQLNSPHSIRKLASTSPRKAQKFVSRVAAHDRSLRVWFDNLPDDVRLSVNMVQGSPEQNRVRTMGVIVFIVHAGSLLNLYRCFVGHPRHAALLAGDASAEAVDAVSQCRIAARECINAAELVRDLVPPSHYLAICVHYLTLSGVVLLRMPTAQPDPQTISDVEKCIRFLSELEPRWTGARRSRAIIEQLLAQYRSKAAAMAAGEAPGFQGYFRNGTEGEAPGGTGTGTKRTYEEFGAVAEEEQQLFWHQIPGSELFPSESVDPGLFSWGDGVL